ELRALAEDRGVELRDLRRPPADLSTATGENLGVDATIVLTVGSDCAIGKMTVSCELDLEARRRGVRSVFVPTGQTGMVIAGWGIAVDAVVADFVAGAAERLVVEGRERGGELLWIEGQGSLLHPVYSGVALGLYHGSVPHLLVLCHEVGRTEIEGAGGGPHPIPPLGELVELHERLALPARPARVAALSPPAGDVTAASFRDGLAALGPPVHAVHGNVDDAALRGRLPETLVVDAGGLRIGMTHDAGPRTGREERLVRRFPGCDAV